MLGFSRILKHLNVSLPVLNTVSPAIDCHTAPKAAKIGSRSSATQMGRSSIKNRLNRIMLPTKLFFVCLHSGPKGRITSCTAVVLSRSYRDIFLKHIHHQFVPCHCWRNICGLQEQSQHTFFFPLTASGFQVCPENRDWPRVSHHSDLHPRRLLWFPFSPHSSRLGVFSYRGWFHPPTTRQYLTLPLNHRLEGGGKHLYLLWA